MRKYFSVLSVLMILMLCLPAAGMADSSDCPTLYEPIEMTDKEQAAVNLFLSNFTEVGSSPVGEWYDEASLVDFAHDHIWFNDQTEYEFGEYFSGNNCRVSDKDIQRIIDKYFYDAPQVDLSQTRFDYRDGYYYHCETGGWINCGFARTASIIPLGDDRYFVSFMIFGGGNHWENSVMSAPMEEILLTYGQPHSFGCAQIYSEDLSDRSTYKMILYSTM